MSSWTSIAYPNDTQSNRIKFETSKLRVLATTDIHMQLLGHDYVTDLPMATNGLSGIATLINRARAEAKNQDAGCILLDNGDLFQGTIIGEILAAGPLADRHPICASLNALRYDAIGLGNHDLDFGIAYLRNIATQLSMPLVSTNLTLHADDFIQKSVLVDCPLPRRDGPDDHLKVGIISALPAKTAVWNRHILDGHADVHDPIESLRATTSDLKARGAQVIVLLAHMGIGGNDPDQIENALSFAKLPGIDAIIAGHTHRRFPGRDHEGLLGVDASNGTLAQRPAIMPGNGGSDLAVLDLTLSKTVSGNWHITDHTSKLRANTAEIAADPVIKKLCMPIHHAAREALSKQVGETDRALHNYFSLAMPTTTAALTARAKARVVRASLAGTPDANTPLLASVAAHTAGGRGGPDHFLCIPKGPVFRRHIAGLNPYGNQIWALRMTGADLRASLENNASIFHTLQPDQPNQPLVNTQIPSFNFDTIYGVTYKIDPRQPVGHRITALQFDGKEIAPDDPFILATTQFRAAGGGGTIAADPDNIILRSPVNIADAHIDALAHPGDTVWSSQIPWSFDCDNQTVQAMLKTSPAASRFLADIAHLKPRVHGQTADGFLDLGLTL